MPDPLDPQYWRVSVLWPDAVRPLHEVRRACPEKAIRVS
jgi:hypothetical protein